VSIGTYLPVGGTGVLVRVGGIAVSVAVGGEGVFVGPGVLVGAGGGGWLIENGALHSATRCGPVLSTVY